MTYEYKLVTTEQEMNEFGAQGFRLKKATARSKPGYIETKDILFVMERVSP